MKKHGYEIRIREVGVLPYRLTMLNKRSRGSSVSTVSGYRLDDQSLIPSREKGFFL
jgi:hypothetical protein